MNLHDELLLRARRTMLQQVGNTDRLIRNLYIRAARSLSEQLKRAKKDSLTERWLRTYLQAVNDEIRHLNDDIELAIMDGARATAQARAAAEAQWLARAAELAGVDDSFAQVLANVPTDALRAMYDGKLYTDGRMLSSRIWNATGRLEGNISEIIQQGAAQKQSPLELARQLEAYVNPKAACPVSWHRVYPDIPFDRKVDYNALRLARTSIIHVAWAADKASAQKNPLCRGLQWRLSDTHCYRQVEVAGEDVCDEYARHDEGLGIGVYPVERVPFPHPQCLCYRTEVLPTLEESADMLRRWARGERTGSSIDDAFERWRKENRAELEALDLPDGFGGISMRDMVQAELDKSEDFSTIDMDSFVIPHSLGAKASNHKIRLPDGSYTTFVEGTRITNVKVIAGKGRERQIDEIDNLLARYGGDPFEWQKKKGVGYIDYYGESVKADVHWYEEPGIGRVKFKVKELLEK